MDSRQPLQCCLPATPLCLVVGPPALTAGAERAARACGWGAAVVATRATALARLAESPCAWAALVCCLDIDAGLLDVLSAAKKAHSALFPIAWNPGVSSS